MEKVKSNVREHVMQLAGEIGQRSFRDIGQLEKTALAIEQYLLSSGCSTGRQPFSFRDNIYCNIITEVRGTDQDRDGILVIGAHYDTVTGTPGADDNASGVACLLELARLTANSPLLRTVRFVAYCLEEPPAYMTKNMGSYVHARSLHKEGTDVFGMISLEMLGYYADETGSQYYPSSWFKLFYPNRGNFIAFVGNLSSRRFSGLVKRSFSSVCSVPVEALNGLSIIPGIDFSDHRNYWKFGFPAFMVTDTAFYRNPNYHDSGDTADTLDYERLAAVTIGLHKALSTI